jgi:hypothetical protein
MLGDQLRGQLSSVLGDHLADEGQTETIAQLPSPAVLDQLKAVLPPESSIRQRIRWSENFFEQVVLEKWLDLPLAALAGKSPRQAAQDDDLKLPLEAAVLLLESGQEPAPEATFARLRQQLGLPQPERIVGDEQTMRTLPVVRFKWLDPQTLSDEDLWTCFSLANQTRHASALTLLCRELLRRDGLQNRVERHQLLGVLASISHDADESLQLLHEAQKTAIKAGLSPARWKVAEFGLRILRAEMNEAQALLHEIQSQHIREPDIADLLMAELVRFGLVRPRATPVRTTATPQELPAATGADLAGAATLESAAAAKTAAQPSKLWLPGMD